MLKFLFRIAGPLILLMLTVIIYLAQAAPSAQFTIDPEDAQTEAVPMANPPVAEP